MPDLRVKGHLMWDRFVTCPTRLLRQVTNLSHAAAYCPSLAVPRPIPLRHDLKDRLVAERGARLVRLET